MIEIYVSKSSPAVCAFKSTTPDTGLSTHRIMKTGWALAPSNNLRTDQIIEKISWSQGERRKERRDYYR